MIVVDASVVIQILVGDDDGRELAARFTTVESTAAPHLLDLEVANVFRRLVREDVLTDERGLEALSDLASLKIARHPHELLLPRIWSLRDALSAYDAAYVALAETLGADLWTRDGRLARAPGVHCRIELL